MQKILKELLKDITDCDSDIPVTGIASHSYAVKNGFLFCTLSRNAFPFIDHAIANGATSIISCSKTKNSDVEYILHKNPRDLYHQVCSNFYPKQPEYLCGVTGTNGKTSVCDFYRQICDLVGRKSASIGTLGVKTQFTQLEESLALTSPDASDLHRILNKLADHDINYVAFEASSHGLVQKRMHSTKIKAAVFTNISQDHFDYHKNFEHYFKSKLKLFTRILKEGGTAIINTDDEYGKKIISILNKKKIITYGANNADIQILQQLPTEFGQKVKIKVFDAVLEMDLCLFGKFQILNLLAAIGIATAFGININKIDFSLIKTVTGRMEMVLGAGNKRIFIDYGHTPDGLYHAASAVKWHFPGARLVLVFGCGGDRDREKRATMGRIASDLADEVIICDDNPRSEDPQRIRADILTQCCGAKEIAQRDAAIEYAVYNSSRDAVVLIAGRGHETKQKFSKHEVDLSDLDLVRSIV